MTKSTDVNDQGQLPFNKSEGSVAVLPLTYRLHLIF